MRKGSKGSSHREKSLISPGSRLRRSTFRSQSPVLKPTRLSTPSTGALQVPTWRTSSPTSKPFASSSSSHRMPSPTSPASSYSRRHSTKRPPMASPVYIFVKNFVIPGIKEDKGTMEIAGTKSETITQGFDSLGTRWQQYHKVGACFTNGGQSSRLSPTGPLELAI